MLSLIGIFWVICWIATVIISSKKGEGCISVFTGFLFGPIALIFAIVGTGNKVKCPYCKELIDKKAIKCPHCQTEISKLPEYGDIKKQYKLKKMMDEKTN